MISSLVFLSLEDNQKSYSLTLSSAFLTSADLLNPYKTFSIVLRDMSFSVVLTHWFIIKNRSTNFSPLKSESTKLLPSGKSEENREASCLSERFS